MRIAFIGQKGLPAKTGGVERHVEGLALKLAEAGHDVFIYGQKDYNQAKLINNPRIKLINIPSFKSKNFEAIVRTLLSCLDLLRRRIDIIHFQSIGPASLIPLARILKPKTPLVFTFHCRDYYHQKWGRLAKGYLKFGEKVGNRYADKVITISKELTKYCQENYHNYPHYIPNGVFVPQKKAAREITDKWGLSKDSYILWAGRLIRHKGVQYLIKAYNEIKTAKKLVIVGAGSYTDDYVQELYKLANGNENIIFTGNQSGAILNELFSNAYLLVQPSESEGLSLTLHEAMSYGLTCLVSDIEANKEAIADTGLSFKNKDYNDLKNKLIELLDKPELARDLGVKAFARAQKDYDWDDINQQTISIYKNLLNK
ncbi:MAG: glycosyltransferase family 4 protein [Candidatus Falkowbacteria bacterium]|nr:glycosyltransferase family 4 protein [Candidatus Falkowbacteria bacterium]